MEVTPEMARAWLWDSRQDGCHLGRARDFARLMDAWKWDENDHRTAVKIKASNGPLRVTNGHHRLLAVLLLGRPVRMRVSFLEGATWPPAS